MTYEDFVKSFNKARKKGDSREPMSEEQFNEMMGFDKREEPEAPKIIKTKQPTLGLNIINSHKIRIAKPPKPKVVLDPKIRVRDRSSETKKPNRSGRVMVAPKISYEGMSINEIKAHKAKLARDWRARTGKTNGKPYSEYTIEEKEALSKQKKKWYQDHKERLVKEARDKRAIQTPEQKEANKERMRLWRANLTPEQKEAVNKRQNASRRKKREHNAIQ